MNFFAAGHRAWLIGTMGLVLGWAGSMAEVTAELLASDAATDPAYTAEDTASWQGLNPTEGENPAGTDNGGFGFDTWDFIGGHHDPSLSPYGQLNHFIDGVDFAASTYNDLGEPAFGLTNANRAFSGYTARATRTFSPLVGGDTLSIDFDNPLLQPLDEFDSAGFLFRLNTGGGPVINNAPLPDVYERVGVSANAGFQSGRWQVAEAAGLIDTGVTDATTASGATLALTLTGDETYEVHLRRLADGEVLFTHSGELKNTGTGGIDTLEITLFGNGSGDGTAGGEATGEREFFFNNLQITSAESGLPGDFNDDGIVDAADYTVWRDHLGGDAAALRGNGSGATTVVEADYDLWTANYGARAGATAGLATAPLAVPEPASGVLLLGAVVAAAGIARRRRLYHAPPGSQPPPTRIGVRGNCLW